MKLMNMSYREDKILSLAGDGPTGQDRDALQKQCALLLEDKLHGLCFSPYEGDQQPGDPFTEAQVRRKLELLQPHTAWIRIFSCTDGNDLIPQLAREYGFKTLVGAWLGEDEDKNEEEMTRLVELAQAGFVDVAAVGNEVLYREEMSEDDLIASINRVRNALPDIPVGYVDAYYRKAQQVRTLIRRDFDGAFQKVDVLLTPTAPSPAFKAGAHADDPLAMYLADLLTIPVNLAGLPAISVPCGFSTAGLPIGMQLIGNVLDEARLLQVAHQYEQAADVFAQRPEAPLVP